jgi:hypothetical protein
MCEKNVVAYFKELIIIPVLTWTARWRPELDSKPEFSKYEAGVV